MKNLDRRNFIKKTSLSGAALAIGSMLTGSTPEVPERETGAQYMGGFAAPKLDTVRAAFIGVGNRGPSHLRFLSKLDGFEIVAISDLYEDKVKKQYDYCQEIGKGKKLKNF